MEVDYNIGKSISYSRDVPFEDKEEEVENMLTTVYKIKKYIVFGVSSKNNKNRFVG